MRVKISVKNLLEAFAIADSGAKAVVRKINKTKTERTPAMLTFEARCAAGGSLKIRTLGEFPAAVVKTSAAVEAIVDEEGVHSCDLEDARAAFAKLKKTAKRGTWVELSSDNFSGSVLTRTGNSALQIPKDRGTRGVEDFADMPAVVVIAADGIRAMLDMSKGMALGVDGELFGHVVSVGHGIAAAMDYRNAEFLALPTVPDDASPIHVPRQVLTVLARSSEPAHIADGYASSGMVRVTWRLIGNRTHADGLFRNVRRLADGKSAATTIDGGELRQALASIAAFTTKGDAIRLLPDECGVRILRYDVRDDANDLYVVVETRQTLADRAEVLVGALWPLPRAVTLPASRLKRILGDADGIDLCLDRDPGGPVAAHVHGDPVVHLMCQCSCPFSDADTI